MGRDQVVARFFARGRARSLTRCSFLLAARVSSGTNGEVIADSDRNASRDFHRADRNANPAQPGTRARFVRVIRPDHQ
jgi:hypothetical protein